MKQTLFEKLAATELECANNVAIIKLSIQEALNVEYDKWKALQNKLVALACCKNVEYVAEYNDVLALLQWDDLSKVPKNEREFLETYINLQETNISIDWENDTLSMFLGDDEILINETYRNGGVFQGGKLIIDNKLYTDDDRNIDESKRNELIESHMESTGNYPGVYMTNSHDNYLIPINTVKKKET